MNRTPIYSPRSSDVSPPDYCSVASAGSSTPPSSVRSLPSDVIAPIFPLGESLSASSSDSKEAAGLSSSSGRQHLPHLLSSTLSLSLSKNSIQLVLAETLIFISPPRRDAFGLGPQDYGLDQAEGGKEAQISGFVNVVSPSRRFVKGIKVELVGQDRLAFPPDSYGREGLEDTVFLTKTLLVGGGSRTEDGIWLEKGVSTWEFSFLLPSTSAVSDRSASGRIQYHVAATVMSGSYLKRDLCDIKEVWIVCNPQTDSNILQLTIHKEGLSPHFGVFALDLQAEHFIIAAPFHFALTLASPPPALTIFGISCYIIQTITVTSHKYSTRTAKVKSPRRYIFREGETGGWTAADFVARARAKGVVLDGSKAKATHRDDEFWRLEMVNRLPNDDLLRSTTLPATDTNLRFSSRLVCEVAFNESRFDPTSGKRVSEGVVNIATIYSAEVFLASCCCTLPSITLPDYDEPSVPRRPKMQGASACGGCACDLLFDKLNPPQIDSLRNGGSPLVGTEGDRLEARRQGGSCPSSSALVEEGRWVTECVDEGTRRERDRSVSISRGSVGSRKAGESY